MSWMSLIEALKSATEAQVFNSPSGTGDTFQYHSDYIADFLEELANQHGVTLENGAMWSNEWSRRKHQLEFLFDCYLWRDEIYTSSVPFDYDMAKWWNFDQPEITLGHNDTDGVDWEISYGIKGHTRGVVTPLLVNEFVQSAHQYNCIVRKAYDSVLDEHRYHIINLDCQDSVLIFSCRPKSARVIDAPIFYWDRNLGINDGF